MKFLKRYTQTLVCSVGLLAVALLAGCGGGGDQGRDPILGLPAATLVSLAVTPAAPGIALGATQQFNANATFSDGSTQTVVAAWSSATPAVATVAAATGLATGTGVGSAVISAAYNGKTASATLTVTPAVLLSIAVTPQAPTVQIAATRQLAVVGTYSDNTTLDLTASSTFVSATPASATVSTGGLVSGVALGTSVITATSNGKSAATTVTVPAATLTSIAVTPAAATVLIGGQQQFVATATYSDNSTAFVTGSATWTSASPAIATIAGTGMASGVAAGTATITATVGAKSGSAALTVSAIVLPPVALPVPLGGAASFAVLAGTSLTNNAGGTTLITGDVGSPSQTTDPTLAAGYTNYKSGAILSGALADLQTAISNANGRSCDVSFAGGVDLGGQTFAPGVYCYAGAINITGTMTLSGPGVYIFRTALTLNSTANSIVALSNGATAANVNWLPVGPTTLGANSVFKGTILGQSAAITVGDNTTLLNGRVLTAAAVTLRNNQITK
ncbi:ice-binding family protein [Duganella sp. HH105]|uniref:ice-binding family protein n=1 Tax=Duganella sp. HH105 TaxID=1781067 RepID=UPI000877BCC1|nr:ice-binding family protein [Duganella sp. HH105]OEZ62701.1 bacterial Ig-like domain (group 2) [Duganella sp. HH105]